jgi:hypothetical protein
MAQKPKRTSRGIRRKDLIFVFEGIPKLTILDYARCPGSICEPGSRGARVRSSSVGLALFRREEDLGAARFGFKRADFLLGVLAGGPS